MKVSESTSAKAYQPITPPADVLDFAAMSLYLTIFQAEVLVKK
jgi:hypothetical protein